jgi:hypothetical protein
MFRGVVERAEDLQLFIMHSVRINGE